MFRPTLFAVAVIASTPVLAQATADTSMPRAKQLANAEAEFAKVDTNKDGQMSRTEIETFQRSVATAMISARNKAIFASLDSDKNGQISAVEFAKISPAPRIDADKVLSIDTNKDGQVSLAEHRTARMATFDQFDGNKDGILTAAEVETASTKK